MQTLTITRPDDWHVHFREGECLQHTVPATAKDFGRALVMPNLKSALTSVAAVLDYQKQILTQAPQNCHFHPYMTLFLNDQVSADDLVAASLHPDILGAKLYPAGATTHSAEGVVDLQRLYPLFDLMQAHNLVLQIHGETPQGDIFEREAQFIEMQLKPLIRNFPNLRMVLEHISTEWAVDFITQAPEHIAATITPQHLLYHRNHLLAGGIKPHYYCLPILKHEKDRAALRAAICSGNPKFFAGTDSAPHAKSDKESACGCAGIFSAPYALAFYTQIFDELDALPKLNAFVAKFGCEFYGLPMNKEQTTLIKQPQIIQDSFPFGTQQVIPLAAGSTLGWSVHESA